MDKIDESENEARMARGELYHAFLPKLTAKRFDENTCILQQDVLTFRFGLEIDATMPAIDSTKQARLRGEN